MKGILEYLDDTIGKRTQHGESMTPSGVETVRDTTDLTQDVKN